MIILGLIGGGIVGFVAVRLLVNYQEQGIWTLKLKSIDKIDHD